jgi:hypothetical protein
VPGFEDLLLNPSFASLARAAEKHPIVVLVTGETTGYGVIILGEARCCLVTLTKATTETLQGLSHRLASHTRSVRSSRGIRRVKATDPPPPDIYRELWTLVMLPIVDALGWLVSLFVCSTVVS